MEKKLTENQIQLSNERIYNISPVKVKYMLTGFYSQYMNIKQFGFVKLLGFSDGESIVTNFLTAVLDSEALAQEALLELRAKDITKILEITKRLNDLQDESEVKNEQPQME
jgi:hypothetical protein